MRAAVQRHALPRFTAAGPAEDLLAALREAPFATAGELIGNGAALIVAPHPDDETLGCGGLMRLAGDAGSPVLLDILTDGAGSHPGSRCYPPPRLARLREEEALEAAGRLGVDADRIVFHRQPDGYLGRSAEMAGEIVKQLTARIDTEAVSAVFVTSPADPHPDHQAAYRLAAAAVAGARTRPAFYSYPVWAWTERGHISFGPAAAAYRLSISSVLAEKRRALDCHASQLGRVIDDSASGFQLTQAHIEMFVSSVETFLEMDR